MQSILIMAESEGFEPSIGDKTYTPLAGARLQPLGQLSKKQNIIRQIMRALNWA